MQKNWRELIKPKKLEVVKLTENYGKFVAEPLERGYGLTIGNSLRRILLSSLQGAAITGVKFDGVLHEFSSIPGVKEDVSDIVLNLKQVRFKSDSDESRVLKLKVKGPKEVKASDIECGADVEILNPDMIVANVGKDGALECEITVETGKGYVPVETDSSVNKVVGQILVDAVFQPVTKVNFDVTNARVGQKTDYDRLSMEVWTTGAIDPQTAVGIASKILKEQLTLFIPFEEVEEVTSEVQEDMEAQPWFNENLFKTVDELELSVRSANCLKNADIEYIGEMVQKTEQEMLKTKNFGRKSLNEIKEILVDMELDFGKKLEGFPTRKELDKNRHENKDAE